jgi:hypothetical protein
MNFEDVIKKAQRLGRLVRQGTPAGAPPPSPADLVGPRGSISARRVAALLREISRSVGQLACELDGEAEREAEEERRWCLENSTRDPGPRLRLVPPPAPPAGPALRLVPGLSAEARARHLEAARAALAALEVSAPAGVVPCSRGGVCAFEDGAPFCSRCGEPWEATDEEARELAAVKRTRVEVKNMEELLGDIVARATCSVCSGRCWEDPTTTCAGEKARRARPVLVIDLQAEEQGPS